MKKTLIILLCSVMFHYVSAQDHKGSIGLGVGGAAASAKDELGDKDSGFGFNFYINGMYNINENFAAGFEYNGNAVVIAGTDPQATQIEFKATILNGYLAKARYAFGNSNSRFYAGLMFGLYRIRPGEISITIFGIPSELVFEPKNTFGFAPEIGVMLGSFQIATSYHFPGKYKADISDGNGGIRAVESTYSMWQFNIGWNIGLVRNY